MVKQDPYKNRKTRVKNKIHLRKHGQCKKSMTPVRNPQEVTYDIQSAPQMHKNHKQILLVKSQSQPK